MDDECRRVLDELEVFLDGECADNLERVVSAHFAGCPPCLQRADFQRELRVLVATKCRDVAPSGLLDRILAGLRTL
jgi:mycothiol system anti-sigma-R factor